MVPFPAVAEDSSLIHSVQLGSGVHPDSCPMGIKRPGCQSVDSPLSSAELYRHYRIHVHGVELT